MPLTLCVQRSHRSPGGSGGHSPGGGGAPTEGTEKEDEVTSTTSTESVVSAMLSTMCSPVCGMPALRLHSTCTVPALCLCSAVPKQYCTCAVPAYVPMSAQSLPMYLCLRSACSVPTFGMEGNSTQCKMASLVCFRVDCAYTWKWNIKMGTALLISGKTGNFVFCVDCAYTSKWNTKIETALLINGKRAILSSV